MRRLFKWLSIYEIVAKKMGIGRDVEALFETEILQDPQKGSVIQGTAGLRKLRVAKQNQGKSGGYRFFYLDYPEVEITFVFYVIAKNESDNISSSEKKALKKIVQKIKKEIK